MAELVVFLIALPALFGIGRFYARLGAAAWRAVRRPRPPAVRRRGIGQVPHDLRYEAALAAAQGIIRGMLDQPEMERHQRLASVTYAILEAMHRLEGDGQAVMPCPPPGAN